MMEATRAIPLRKAAGWEFFNEHTEVCDAVDGKDPAALPGDERAVVEWFIASVEGSRRVLDIGCGSGFPAIYLAPHVGEIVGIDAAPNMLASARENTARLGVRNVSFQAGQAGKLDFDDHSFDGITACGLLESMDWDGVRAVLPEMRRVLRPQGRIAVLEQDWELVLSCKGQEERQIRSAMGRPLLRVVTRTALPAMERDERYILRPESAVGRRVLDELKGKSSAGTDLTPADLDPLDVEDAHYDECAQFGQDSIGHLFRSSGFENVQVHTMDVWGRVLLLEGTKPVH